jgi:hypothetical protein
MIARLELQLQAEIGAMLPQAHAGDLVGAIRPGVGGSDESDAWSASPLDIGQHADRHGLVSVKEGESYRAAVGVLDAEAAGRVGDADLPERIILSGVPFRLISAEHRVFDPMAWYDESLQRGGPSRLRVDWRSPTAFSTRGHLPPLPIPEAVVGAWIRRWDQRNPIVFGDEGIAMFVSAVRVAPQLIRGAAWRDAHGFLQGFSGRATFNLVRTAPPYAAAALSVLARFAAVAGTGVRTHLGMGVTAPEGLDAERI